jgi:DNA polymerase-4
MDRVILHSDMNNFYASVECLYDPTLRNKPVAVGGDPEARHGIVLAKNYIAKKFGVQTGEALWQARQKCPEIVFVSPHFERYLRFSKMAGEIYRDFTNQIEPFGLDESWLDVTGSRISGDGKTIADLIRERVKAELGITASVGVSYNKIFAKLGSDMKKPDATTVILSGDFREKVWPLPVQELLYVGNATYKKLKSYGIRTIGALAQTDPETLNYWFGVIGIMLWQFANGLDASVVSGMGSRPVIKSVGNSTTTPRDLICDEDMRITVYMLAESVAARLREHGFICRTVQVSVRDNKLVSFERQIKLAEPACASGVLAQAALQLIRQNVKEPYAIRSLGVRACDLLPDDVRQMSLLTETEKVLKEEDLERTVDTIRRRYGHFSIQRGLMLTDKKLSCENPKEDHTIHPIAFLK